MSDQFKPGVVVKLKSGGPKMTIEKIESGKALCHWFDNAQPQVRFFDVSLLEPH